MAVRGIRGATTADANTEAAIVEATTEMLASLSRENQVDPREVAGVWFTTTSDLTAEFPALAARRMGWKDTPLLCAQEMTVPPSNRRSVPRCIRVMVLLNTDRPAAEMRFVYLRGARGLRSDA